jgi:hypothetical protein
MSTIRIDIIANQVQIEGHFNSLGILSKFKQSLDRAYSLVWLCQATIAIYFICPVAAEAVNRCSPRHSVSLFCQMLRQIGR